VTGWNQEIEMDRRRYPRIAVCLLVVGLALSGCASRATARSGEPGQPARVRSIAGSDRSQVILTTDAAKRVGIRTEPILAAPVATGSSPRRSVIPLAAVLYDKDGKTWTYSASKPLTFVREAVVIAHIDGERATLSSGPAVGTLVVTVGGAELLGAEYGVPGE
jgi:hypothetical protein